MDPSKTWFDMMVVENTTKQLDNTEKDTLLDKRTLRSNYITSKLHAVNNPDILFGKL